MATAVGLTCIIAILLLWDLQYKFMQAISRRWAIRALNRNVSSMAHRLLRLAVTYAGLSVSIDRRLWTSPPSPTVVVANHQSVADIVVLLDAFRSHALRFVAKKELSRGFPGVSEVLRIQGHALIDRSGDFRQGAAELQRLSRDVRRGVSPAIFPEGTRSRDGAVHTFHPGAVRSILSRQSVPITAVAVDGGQHFVHLSDLVGDLNGVVYRAELAGVFHHDGSKSGIRDALAAAESSIAALIDRWRNEHIKEID